MRGTPVHGRIHFRGAWRVMVGMIGPKWITFAFFADGGSLKLGKAPAKDARSIKPVIDSRDCSTPAAFARRFLYGRRASLKPRVRGFLEAINADC